MQFAGVFCVQLEGGQQRKVDCSEISEVVRRMCGEMCAYEGGVQEVVMSGSLCNEGC